MPYKYDGRVLRVNLSKTSVLASPKLIMKTYIKFVLDLHMGPKTVVTDYSGVRGFNYTPSYCTTLFEMWSGFRREVWRLELQRGKKYFPSFNCARIWLDFDPYLRDPKRFVANLGSVLNICGDIGIKLMPTLFNRWHNFTYDFGGIYVDHFINEQYKIFERYLRDVVSPFAGDERIIMWDLCNEPQVWDMKYDSQRQNLGGWSGQRNKFAPLERRSLSRWAQ